MIRINPNIKIALLSAGAILTLYVGSLLGWLLQATTIRETIEAIPVLVCFALVLHYTKPAPAAKMHWTWRAVLLALPFIWIALSDIKIDVDAISKQPLLYTIAAWEAAMIGVSEELVFRFSLQRLWGRYGHLFFVGFSTIIFGTLHLEGGVTVAIFSALIGFTFAAARVAGMPILVLIIIHGLYDLPNMLERHGLSS